MSNNLQPTTYNLTIAWLYPELMSTYGDRGNIIVLQKIAEDNGVFVKIERINHAASSSLLATSDLIFMGGAQDLQQEIVNKDLLGEKGKALKDLIEAETPGLYVCGAYQFLGHYYKDAYGTEIKGLGVFDMYTESYKTKERLIGNIVVESNSVILGNKETPESTHMSDPGQARMTFVGFENHGGRTYIKNKTQALAKVVKGYGNNGEDGTEGIRYKNSIGTYMHGPILPSNPELAVLLLEKALERKYGKKIDIKFEDDLSKKAKQALLHRLQLS